MREFDSPHPLVLIIMNDLEGGNLEFPLEKTKRNPLHRFEMKDLLGGLGIIVIAGGILVGLFSLFPPSPLIPSGALISRDAASPSPVERVKTTEELIAEARARSGNIKALYMTADVANDPGAGATRLRERIIRLADTTEINAIVIDVKEVCGADYNEKNLTRLLNELKQKNIWAIARIVAFKDASQIKTHPEWYLTRKAQKIVSEKGCRGKQHLVAKGTGTAPAPIFWRDDAGGYWLDPASPEARGYLLNFSKRMVDAGFNELQFDYIRFPSDGDVSQAVYPLWDGKAPKHKVLKSFFTLLRNGLKEYKPDIILSADIFGYVAAQHEDQSIGQRLTDIGDIFDYVSFMVYPSHYYVGLMLPAHPGRGLDVINYTYQEARANPGIVVGRSLLAARDFFDGKIAASSRATSTPSVAAAHAKIRPWLEDFFHEQDRVAGRPYGAEKVRMQIDAAEQTTGYGWMLWNAANIYSKEALKKEAR